MHKLDISIVVPGLPFNGLTFDEQSLGGSESAGYYMGRALAKMGHRVTVFCNGEPAFTDDVNYLPLAMFKQYAEFTQHDVTIIQRAPELFNGPIRSRLNLLWCHDLALVRQDPAFKGVAWNWDKVLVLSEFQRQQYKAVYGLPDERMFLTRNGVDLATVARAHEGIKPDDHNPFRLVYSARPERGLDVLLEEIMPRILALEPRAQLAVSTYFNPVDHLKEFYGQCQQAAQRLGESVTFVGNLTKVQLYRLMIASGIYAYPMPSKIAADFDEISCISAMEAMACGLPVISTARGALPETLSPSAGTLIHYPVHSAEYYDAFAKECVRIMQSSKVRQRMSEAGVARAKQLDWSGVAEDWSDMFETEIRKFSSDKASLANHFWRRSDIYAAEHVLKDVPRDDPATAYVRDQIERHFAFIHEPDGFKKQYERIGIGHDDVFRFAPGEQRFQALWQWFQRNRSVKTVLDWGCAHGSYALNMAERTGVQYTGVDIDKHSVAMARKFQAQYCKSPAALSSEFMTIEDLRAKPQQQFDAAQVFEVLEHVADPAALLREIEQYVKDDGHVVITVPFGPWEYSSYRGYPWRCHVWEFDLHDLHELIEAPKGAEAQVRIQAMPGNHSPETGEALGWWFISYKVTAATRGKLGSINLDRKCWLQRPRQTVSANIMAGPNCEETLLWQLRSLQHVADEVIIVDCGMSEVAKFLTQDFDAELPQVTSPHAVRRVKIIPGPDPKQHGFETPRNLGLQHVTQNWVLWIDTDERLMDPQRITKYLRDNMYNGYSIRQHHFAVDTHFDPDMPVRMFRNTGKMRFFGMIHEHPETELNKGPGVTIVLADVHIAHVGYLIESGRQARFQRNYPMLQADIAKYPERLLQKHFIMRDNMLLVGYTLARNGGKKTPQIEAWCRETIELYKKHFLGRGHFTNVDPGQYYSDALAVLGEGISVAFQTAVDKVQAKPNGTTVMRFENADVAAQEVARRLKDAAAPFEHRYY
jgi:2-polyprenyl-3-methyl-5-hydroxy-6-metoxy-1,4-benzoquinol methylase/glycosyltransferase involved in cell wall biosynthesis